MAEQVPTSARSSLLAVRQAVADGDRMALVTDADVIRRDVRLYNALVAAGWTWRLPKDDKS